MSYSNEKDPLKFNRSEEIKSFKEVLNGFPESYSKILLKIGSGEKIDEHLDEIWKFIDSLEIKEQNVFALLGFGLKYKYHNLVCRCKAFIRENMRVFLDINEHGKIRFEYLSGKISLNDLVSNLIEPMFTVFEESAGVQRNTHAISMDILGDEIKKTDLQNFFRMYFENIIRLEFLAFDDLDNEFLDYTSSYCTALKSIVINSNNSLTGKGFLKLNKLPNLEEVLIDRARSVEFLDLQNVDSLRNLQINRLEELQKISIENSHNLKRLDISQCENLQTLSILGASRLEEIVIHQSHEINFIHPIKELPNLKICIVNDKKIL